MKKFFLVVVAIAATIVINAQVPPTATISGTYTVCAGNTISIPILLSNGPIWDVTFKDNFIESEFTVTGITTEVFSLDVTPLSSRTYSIVSVSNRTTKPVSGDGTATVTVNERPMSFPIICDFPSFCEGKTSSDVVLPSSESDVVYQLFKYGELVPKEEKKGTGTSIAFKGQEEPGLYYVMAKKANGCPSILGIITLEIIFF